MEILSTDDYKRWYNRLHLRDRVQIDTRIARIEKFEHFGDWKYLNDNVAELRWKNGRRVYFTKTSHKAILLLCGGLKNVQKKDIKKARHILQRYAHS